MRFNKEQRELIKQMIKSQLSLFRAELVIAGLRGTVKSRKIKRDRVKKKIEVAQQIIDTL